jgi:uncharacterized membrane protein YdjX (TVP38/TMEM64 family)
MDKFELVLIPLLCLISSAIGALIANFIIYLFSKTFIRKRKKNKKKNGYNKHRNRSR